MIKLNQWRSFQWAKPTLDLEQVYDASSHA